MIDVVVLDYGSGNIRSAQRALETTGARVTVTADFDRAMDCDGLVVPGVGAFNSCITALRSVRGDTLISRRRAGGQAVLGICVGMQVLFDSSDEHASTKSAAGMSEWPGKVKQLEAPVLPHMGWNTVEAAQDSQMFNGVSKEHFYFVHSYAVTQWELQGTPILAAPKVSWCNYGQDFVAAVENGPLWATQFHPEKSGTAGLKLLNNWVLSVAKGKSK